MALTRIVATPTQGELWSGVIQTCHQQESGNTVCKLVHLGKQKPLEVGRLGSLYLVSVLSLEPLTFDFGSDSCFVLHTDPTPLSWRRIKKVCAGLGGIGLGCRQLGAQIVASVDVSPLACEHLVMNRHGVVIHGDICQDHVIAKLHQAGGPEPAVLTAGFPCGPFSPQPQGDMRAFQDNRSQTFYGVLRAAWLTQASAILLECVPNAGNHPEAKAGIQELATLLNMQVHHLTFSLQDVWPMTRTRWWCLLQPASWPPPELTAWQRFEAPPAIHHILQEWPLWQQHDEIFLQLTAVEHQMYRDPQFGTDQRLLNVNQCLSSGSSQLLEHFQ